MTGVKTNLCSMAVLLACSQSITMAAAPSSNANNGFDQWSISSGTVSITDLDTVTAGVQDCPTGWTCSPAVTGDGFYQRQVDDGSGNSYFQTIITDSSETGITVRQDMSNVSAINPQFSYTTYEQIIDSDTNETLEPVTESPSPESACYSTPTGTDNSSGFIPDPTGSSINAGFTVTVPSDKTLETDVTPPTITPPPNIEIAVTVHANFIDLDPSNGGTLPEITDDQTKNFDFSRTNNAVVGPLPPGRHTITWLAKDEAHNSSSAEQLVDILPTVNFETDQITQEYGSASVTAHLSGHAPEYPVRIPFTVSGTATRGDFIEANIIAPPGDHNAGDGEIIIHEGTIGRTFFRIADDDIAEGDESVVFTMGLPSNAIAGKKTEHTVTISETPQTLTLDFEIMQKDRKVRFVSTDNGLIKVTAAPLNRAWWAPVKYDWSQTNSSLVSADCTESSFYVDPANLSPGLYRIHLTAFEPDQPDLASSAEWWLRLSDDPIQIGLVDKDSDGIPNRYDFVDTPHLIPGNRGESYKSISNKVILNESPPHAGTIGWSISSTEHNINYPMLIATEPGLKLAASTAHLWRYENTKDVAIDWSFFNQYGHTFGLAPEFTVMFGERPVNYYALSDPLFNYDDPLQNGNNLFITSVEISYLSIAGGVANLVIPHAEPVDTIEGYSLTVRNYTPAFGWKNYLEDHNNVVFSSMRTDDYCPSPGSEKYQIGLVNGFECLQLTLEDGGPNDVDGYRNGRITFHGGVLLHKSASQEPMISETIESTMANNTPEGLNTNTENGGERKDGGGGVILMTSLLCLLGLKRRPKI